MAAVIVDTGVLIDMATGTIDLEKTLDHVGLEPVFVSPISAWLNLNWAFRYKATPLKTFNAQ